MPRDITRYLDFQLSELRWRTALAYALRSGWSPSGTSAAPTLSAADQTTLASYIGSSGVAVSAADAAGLGDALDAALVGRLVRSADFESVKALRDACRRGSFEVW